jgi:hypothetical protein
MSCLMSIISKTRVSWWSLRFKVISSVSRYICLVFFKDVLLVVISLYKFAFFLIRTWF